MTGRFDANRDCCQLRLLAGAPGHSRREVYERVRKDEGVVAVAELKRKVGAEYQRQQNYKAAIVRERLEREAAKGRIEAAALLKKIKESNMNIPPLERGAASAPASTTECA